MIRRDVAITGDQVEPLLDLDTDGIPARRIELPVTVDADETVHAETRWFTDGWSVGNGAAALITENSRTTTVDIAPDELLEPGDTQDVTLYASSSGGDRGVDTELGADATFELMPRLEGIDLRADGPVASWQAIPIATYDRVSFHVADGAKQNFIFATKRYLEATGTTSIQLDTTSPDFDPEWNIPQAGFVTFSVERNTELATFWTSMQR